MNDDASYKTDISCDPKNQDISLNKKYYKNKFKTHFTEMEFDRYIEERGGPNPANVYEKFNLLDRATAKYIHSFQTFESKKINDTIKIKHYTIQPGVTVDFGNKILAGSNRGEFGGELVLIDENNQIIIIGDINVQNIHVMQFGAVVVSGLAHGSQNFGAIHFVNENFKLEKIFGLTGMPVSSWFLENGDLLINSYPDSVQVLTKVGFLMRVQCIDRSDKG